jgi:hypothetical protein
MPLHIARGMKPKEVHEVPEFAAYVDALAKDISLPGKEPAIVDFGSVQNYLGPAPPMETRKDAISEY